VSIIDKVNKSLEDNISSFQRKVGAAVAKQVLRRMVVHSKGELKPLFKEAGNKVMVVVPKTKDDPNGKKALEINRVTGATRKAIEETINPRIIKALIKREMGG